MHLSVLSVANAEYRLRIVTKVVQLQTLYCRNHDLPGDLRPIELEALEEPNAAGSPP